MENEADSIDGRVDALAALSLAGPEAVAFAQRICANDVATLDVGDWQWNCVLSPQGRVLALFRLWRRAEDALTLVLPAIARAHTHALLRRYQLRSKLVLGDENLGLVAGDSCSIEASRPGMRADDGRWLGFAEEHWARQAPTRDVSSAWQALEVSQGVPGIDPNARESFTPQALSLDRLAAFSVRKGCYPGQEIVARMHFLGQNKRELRRFASSVDIPAGTTLSVGGGAPHAIGMVVTAVSRANGCELLAVVQRAAGEVQIFSNEPDDGPLRALPLKRAPLAMARSAIAKA